MDKVAFLNFLSASKRQGASGADVAATIKEATGQDCDPGQLEALMAQMPNAGQGGEEDAMHAPQPQHGAPQHGQHPHHAQHGHPAHAHHAPNFEETQEHNIPLSEEQIDALAHEIAQHIAQQEQGGMGADPSQGGAPQEDPMAGMSPEHMQGLNLAKSASYISGFLKSAMAHGAGVEEAIDIYGTQLSNTVALLKDAAARENDIKKLAEKLDENTLAYFEGLAEKAASEGLSYDETIAVLKEAGYGEILKEKLK